MNNQDFRAMKDQDRQYGEKMESKPVQKKEKHRPNFTRMSIEEMMQMEEDFA